MSVKQDYGLPASVTVVKHANGIELKRYWRTWKSFGYLVFGILWFGFLYREGPMALQDIPYSEQLQILLLLVGAVIAYYGLTQIINHSSVRTFLIACRSATARCLYYWAKPLSELILSSFMSIGIIAETRTAPLLLMSYAC